MHVCTLIYLHMCSSAGLVVPLGGALSQLNPAVGLLAPAFLICVNHTTLPDLLRSL